MEKKNIKKTEPNIIKSVTEEKNTNNKSGIKVADKKEIKTKESTNKAVIKKDLVEVKEDLKEAEIKKATINKEVKEIKEIKEVKEVEAVKVVEKTAVKRVPKPRTKRKTVAVVEEKHDATVKKPAK
ncbi:MAG TPA: hypothetical protein VIK26_00670, partial [Clostridium sp.]